MLTDSDLQSGSIWLFSVIVGCHTPADYGGKMTESAEIIV